MSRALCSDTTLPRTYQDHVVEKSSEEMLRRELFAKTSKCSHLTMLGCPSVKYFIQHRDMWNIRGGG
eukprot:2076009-Karenia_brevis.AAC.1